VIFGSAVPGQQPLPGSVDIEGAFRSVELQGGKVVRDEWARAGRADWFANASTELRDGKLAVLVSYSQAPAPGLAIFRYDVVSGGVERTR
jgi:hypothetical protein